LFKGTLCKKSFAQVLKSTTTTNDLLVMPAFDALFFIKTGKHVKATDSQAHRCGKFGLELIKRYRTAPKKAFEGQF
jgi:hypothetical protein